MKDRCSGLEANIDWIRKPYFSQGTLAVVSSVEALGLWMNELLSPRARFSGCLNGCFTRRTDSPEGQSTDPGINSTSSPSDGWNWAASGGIASGVINLLSAEDTGGRSMRGQRAVGLQRWNSLSSIFLSRALWYLYFLPLLPRHSIFPFKWLLCLCGNSQNGKEWRYEVKGELRIAGLAFWNLRKTCFIWCLALKNCENLSLRMKTDLLNQCLSNLLIVIK